MHKRPKILVVGSLVMDLIVSTPRFPERGETVIGTDFKTAPGGKGANQAVQAARLGAEVVMVGKVGLDSYGSEILASMTESGVNTKYITRSQFKPTAIGNVQLEITNHHTANRIVVVPGANMDITISDVQFLNNMIDDFDMVMLQLEIPIEINEYIAKIAYQHGVPVMLNSAPASPLSAELLRHITYISPNEHEAFDLTGIPVNDETSANTAINALLNKGVRNVLITMGDKGAVFGNREQFLVSPSVDYNEVVDPTAAGDSFIAAFCIAVSLGLPYDEALKFANSTAAITVSRMGAQPSLPKIDTVLDLIKSQGHSISHFETLIY